MAADVVAHHAPDRAVPHASGGRSVRRAELARLAGALHDALSSLAQSLYQSENDECLTVVPGLAEAGGQTGRLAREIVALVSPIWVQYLAVKDIADQVNAAVAAGRHAQCEMLLGPEAIALPDGTTTSALAHVRDLQQLLEHVSARAVQLTTTVRSAQSRLDAATLAVNDLIEWAKQLDAATDAAVTAAVGRLQEVTERFAADPLTARLGDLDAFVQVAREHIQNLERLRDNLPNRLTEASDVSQEIVALIAEGGEALSETRKKIARPQGLLEPMDPFVVDGDQRSLQPWLARIRKAAKAGRWRAASAGLESWRRVADPVLSDARRIRDSNRRPLDQRNELRSLVKAYRAKAVGRGAAENLPLERFYQEACRALYVGRCDVGAAEAGVHAYVRAVNDIAAGRTV